MVSDESLREEITKLKRQKQQALSIQKQNLKKILFAKKQRLETAKLKKELADLRNPKSLAFKKNLKRIGRLGGRALLLIGEDIDKRFRARAGIKRTMPKGEIQFKKVMGGYKIFIAGKEFEFAKDKRILLLKVNIIRRMQGKKPIRRIKHRKR